MNNSASASRTTPPETPPRDKGGHCSALALGGQGSAPSGQRTEQRTERSERTSCNFGHRATMLDIDVFVSHNPLPRPAVNFQPRNPDNTGSMAALEGVWLFTRGQASVRISRRGDDNGRFVLIVHGPGTDLTVIECLDVASCIERQQDVERRLVAEGYFLDQFTSDRRVASVPPPNRVDRRRHDRLFLVSSRRRHS